MKKRVVYWSVYCQVWQQAYYQEDVPDHEWAAQDSETRKRLSRLPKREEEVEHERQ